MSSSTLSWGIAAVIGLFFIPAVLGVMFARGSAFDDLRGSIEGECRYSAPGIYYTLDGDTQLTHVADGGVPVAAPSGIDFAVPSGARARAIDGTEIADSGIGFANAEGTPSAAVANHNGYGYEIDGRLNPVAFNRSLTPFAGTDPWQNYIECDPTESDQPAPNATQVVNGNGFAAVDYEPALAGNTFTPILRVMILFLPLLLVASAVVYIWSARRASGARR